MKKKLKLRNYRSLASGGHLLVTYKVDNFRTNDVKTRSKTTETKKKDGTVVKNTTYWVAGTYTFPMQMEVLDENGGSIFESVVGAEAGQIRYPSGTKTYSTGAAASKAWSEKRTETYASMQKSLLTKNFNTLNGQLRTEIDFQEKKDNFFLEYPKGKKAENAEVWLEHATATKNILDTIDSNAPLPKAYLATALEPHVNFWKEQVAAYPADNKKTQRYHHCATFNLATLETVLENPGNAMTMSKSLEENVKWNKSRSRFMYTSADNLSKTLTAYPGKSRHFALRDVSKAEGPPAAPTYGMPEPIKPIYYTTAAYIVMGGERKAGTVIMRENMDIKLGGKPNFRFINGNEEEIAIDINTIDGFGFGDFDFVVEKWADSGIKGRRNFMRVLLDGPRMQYLEYYPSYRGAGGLEVEFLKPKGGDLISLSVANARWLSWKKAFAKVFVDCAGLSQKIAAGEYRRNIDDIAAAVAEYNEGNCEVAAESEDDGK